LSIAIVWVLLYLFERLTQRMPVAGFAGRLIQAIHQAGSVSLVTILVIWLLVDVIQSRRNRK
jgi:glutaredoxin-related protein